MSAEADKATVLRYFLESHNAPYSLEVIGQTCSPEYGQGQRDWLEMERTAFPDKQFIVDDTIAEADTVVLRYTLQGTHQGSFWTPLGMIAATGKPVRTTAVGIYRLSEGKIVGEETTIDWLDVVQQLGGTAQLPRQEE